ncbi:hypothetical protein [Lyngbya aestuarii]|uniref:hypothetical protein n=1 Tax=Lyngbya aestuarii TaxID=118322 RepID=UPI00403E1CE4
MTIKVGQEFTENSKGYRWQISKPWLDEKSQKQIGWECVAVERKIRQSEKSKWFNEELVNFNLS